MTMDWIGPRMYRPSLEEVLRGALAPAAPNVHSVTRFRYPSRGGFAAYLERFTPTAPIELGHEAANVDPFRRRIGFTNGRELEYDQLISSVPLPDLIAIPDAPSDVRAAADQLACSACVLVNVGVASRHLRYAPRKYKPLDRSPEDLMEPVIHDLVRCGVIDESDEVLYKGAVFCE